MGERFESRTRAVAGALAARVAAPGVERAPDRSAPHPRRAQPAARRHVHADAACSRSCARAHPAAEVTLLANPAFVPLYAKRPYGVRALPFTPRDAATTRALLAEPAFDLAIVAGRQPLRLARGRRGCAPHRRACGRHARGPRAWFVDDARAYPAKPGGVGRHGRRPRRRRRARALRARPTGPRPRQPRSTARARPMRCCTSGASTPLKQWLPERWLAVARRSRRARAHGGVERGPRRGGARRRRAIPQRRYASYAGQPRPRAALAPASRARRCWSSPDTGRRAPGRAPHSRPR